MADSEAFGAFIEITYDETLALLVDTRELLSTLPKRQDPDAPEPLGRAETMAAISNLTWRMTELMSLLLLQKGILAKEIDLEDASKEPSFNLPDISFDEFRHDSPDVDLPVSVRGLIDRSRRIGDRAIKLEISLQTARNP